MMSALRRVAVVRSSPHARRLVAPLSHSPTESIAAKEVVCSSSSALLIAKRTKGDFGFNHIHSSNPQHGGSYARHERAMNDGEVEDFMKSVKGWSRDEATNAIWRSVYFDSFGDAYRFMGRLYAYCYCTDKYPPITWDNTRIDIQLYSPTFKGLTKRDACVAAFVNDQMNMLKKAKLQRAALIGSEDQQRVQRLLADDTNQLSSQQEVVPEVRENLRSWKDLM